MSRALISPPGARRRRLAFLALLLGGALAAVAAKNPDKPQNADKPARMEKIERKRERMNMGGAFGGEFRAPMRAERPDRGGPSLAPDARFDQFRLVVERNIFNPSRIARVRATAEEKQVHVDTIALVGTMESDQGTLAFFDSPDGVYRKALHEGQSVGDFKVQAIKPDQVELVRAGKPLSLHVAQQLRRTEGGDWTISAVERSSSEPAAVSTLPTPVPQPVTPTIPSDASDALRRLMEQRQKQLKQ